MGRWGKRIAGKRIHFPAPIFLPARVAVATTARNPVSGGIRGFVAAAEDKMALDEVLIRPAGKNGAQVFRGTTGKKIGW